MVDRRMLNMSKLCFELAALTGIVWGFSAFVRWITEHLTGAGLF